MTAHRYGVKYPDGTWSGPISPTAKDLKPYAREHHGTIYEAGTAEDPAPRYRPEAPAWFGPEYYEQACGRIERAQPYESPVSPYDATEEYVSPYDVAAGKADIENDRRKCYPEDLAAKFGGA
jgi:hypothetical protein